MAALVRHDTRIAALFPRADAETPADATEIARLYDALDCISEQDNPRTARLARLRWHQDRAKANRGGQRDRP
jgi:hypothetical protein